jgi:hypothetical protein
MRKPATASQLIPRLKPYAGVGENFLTRHAAAIASVAMVVVCLPYGFAYAIFTPWLLVPLLVPIAILMVLIVWALPDIFTPPEAALEKMFFGFLLAFLLWPNYLALDIDGLPWITLIRIIGTPMAILLLVCASAAPLFRKTMAEILRDTPTIWKIFVIYTVLQATSIPFSKQIGDSIAELVISQTTETAIFFVCCYVFRHPGRAQRWAMILWLSSLFIGFIAVLEFMNNKVLWSGHVPRLLQVRDEVVAKILAGAYRPTTGQYRAQSVFTTSLGLSEFNALVIPFAIHFASSSTYKPFVRFAAGATVPFLLYVILLTDSRLGLMGAFFGSMIYLFIWAWKKLRNDKNALIPAALMVAYPVIFTLAVVASFVVGRIRAKVWGTGQYNDSNQGRIEQLNMAIPKIFEYPFGHGTGTAGYVLGWTNPIGELSIDSYFLTVALDTGLMGLISFVALFLLAGCVGTSVVIRKVDGDPEYQLLQPLAVSMFVFLLIKIVFAQDDTNPLMYMALGIIVAMVYRVKSEDRKLGGEAPVTRAR